MEPIIENTPFPTMRYFVSKYDATFAKMQPGQCLRMETKDVGKVAHAMNKWIKKNGKTDKLMVRTLSKQPDGYGRVWLLSKPVSIKMADVPGRKITNLVG